MDNVQKYEPVPLPKLNEEGGKGVECSRLSPLKIYDFVRFVREGKVPDPRTLEWLADVFEKYINREGESDLEDLLELKGRPFKVRLREYLMAQDAHQLIQLGASKNFAAACVIEKADSGLYTIGDETLDAPESERTIKNWLDSYSAESFEDIHTTAVRGLPGRIVKVPNKEKINILLNTFPTATRSRIVAKLNKKGKLERKN